MTDFDLSNGRLEIAVSSMSIHVRAHDHSTGREYVTQAGIPLGPTIVVQYGESKKTKPSHEVVMALLSDMILKVTAELPKGTE